ncbi:MAG: hypothetical protein ACREBS_04095 [Nitrososphaerales archaeon]
MKAKVALLSTVMVALFAVTMIPSVVAYSGQIVCLTPASCASNQTLSLNGPGTTATATFKLTSNAPSGTTINYYVCPQTAATCSSNVGTDNGWSWTFTPASGTTGAGGTETGLSLSVTAPSTVTPTDQTETLTIYACSQTGTTQTCASVLQQVASLSVTATVPQFGLGLGLTLVIGLFGLLFMVRRKGGFSLPSTPMI